MFIAIFLIFAVVIVAMTPAFVTFFAKGYVGRAFDDPPFAFDYFETAQTSELLLGASPTVSSKPPPASPPIPTEGLVFEKEPAPEVVTISISAAGDVIFGGDHARPSSGHFRRIFAESGEDMNFFFYNVRHIFREDDLTIVNYEGTFTYQTRNRGAEFNFRAAPAFAEALALGYIDAVSLANNHSRDYLEQGYQDTQDALDAVGVAFFGNANNTIMEINGIRVGLFGYTAWHDTAEMRANVTRSINYLRDNGAQLIIAYFHWGREKHYRLHVSQQPLGRFTIDSGAHLVLGAHPHVVQGIEVYNGWNIVYSLANFSFGGNAFPFDMDSFIFRQTFSFIDGVLQTDNDSEIIPVRTTSVTRYNNLQPTLAEGEDYYRIRRLMNTLSTELNPSGVDFNPGFWTEPEEYAEYESSEYNESE